MLDFVGLKRASMSPSKHNLLRRPVARSRTHPFVTLLLSDLNGPNKRQRLVMGEAPLPDWLRGQSLLFGPGFGFVVAAMGKARLGSRTRIQSIVVYPAQLEVPEIAYVYIEEHTAGGRGARAAAPVHVVRCAPLPRTVRFVEVLPQSRASQSSLRVL